MLPPHADPAPRAGAAGDRHRRRVPAVLAFLAVLALGPGFALAASRTCSMSASCSGFVGTRARTVLKGDNKMRVFQEENFGPVLAVTTFTDDADALAIANDTLYGLGAGVWTRDGTRAYKMGRGIKAGRVWTNCYHQYPAGASFGGYKISGIGRENHLMMLDHYSQTKNLLVSYSTKPLGLF